MVKSSDPADGGGTIPALPTGQSWKFKHFVEIDGGAKYWALNDDYSETRTLYSQSDTVYAVKTTFASAPIYENNNYVGQSNNCRGMHIYFAPMVESSSTLFGTGQELGQVKRSRTEYDYDAYGNQTLIKEHGEIGLSSDDRSTSTIYANAIRPLNNQWIIGRVGRSLVYSGFMGNPGALLVAETQYFYDDETT